MSFLPHILAWALNNWFFIIHLFFRAKPLKIFLLCQASTPCYWSFQTNVSYINLLFIVRYWFLCLSFAQWKFGNGHQLNFGSSIIWIFVKFSVLTSYENQFRLQGSLWRLFLSWHLGKSPLVPQLIWGELNIWCSLVQMC